MQNSILRGCARESALARLAEKEGRGIVNTKFRRWLPEIVGRLTQGKTGGFVNSRDNYMNGETYQTLNLKLDASDRFAGAVIKAQLADAEIRLAQEYANLDKTITNAMNRASNNGNPVKNNNTLNKATNLARRMFQEQFIPGAKKDLSQYGDFIRQEQSEKVRRFEEICRVYS